LSSSSLVSWATIELVRYSRWRQLAEQVRASIRPLKERRQLSQVFILVLAMAVFIFENC
jgi:hypothetical protein